MNKRVARLMSAAATATTMVLVLGAGLKWH